LDSTKRGTLTEGRDAVWMGMGGVSSFPAN